MNYVDGYVTPVPKKNLSAYRQIAQIVGKIFREHGALEYRECVGEDLKSGWGVKFPKLLKTKSGETIFFSYIVFKSRAHRDRVNAKVMKDKRVTQMMKERAMPFDCYRMVYGGFKVFVEF